MPDGIIPQSLVPSSILTQSQDQDIHSTCPPLQDSHGDLRSTVLMIASSDLHAYSPKLFPVRSPSLGTPLGGSMTLALIADTQWWLSPPSYETLMEIRKERRLRLAGHSPGLTMVRTSSMRKPQFAFRLWVIFSEWILSCTPLSWEAGCAEIHHWGPLQ